ncbi:MAG: dipeptide/oligopeptide/nickel ABC transporter ATP-binding protein, partial [Catenulisporales bacterium]|nr:dipeptide/oligopeptide/nickel ABC transporter ATP-binding protein [Catenulisporales bacterium]
MSTETTAQTSETSSVDPDALLNVTDLVKHFPIRRGLLQRQVGAVQAVDGISFSVRAG